MTVIMTMTTVMVTVEASVTVTVTVTVYDPPGLFAPFLVCSFVDHL